MIIGKKRSTRTMCAWRGDAWRARHHRINSPLQGAAAVEQNSSGMRRFPQLTKDTYTFQSQDFLEIYRNPSIICESNTM